VKLGSESRSFDSDVLHALAFDLFHVSARILLNIIYAQLPPSTSNLNRTHLPIHRSHQAPAPIGGVAAREEDCWGDCWGGWEVAMVVLGGEQICVCG
jgi:hypothetical protein